MWKIFLPIILFIGFGYNLASDQSKDVCVSILCSITDRNVIFSSSGTSENRVYLNLTSYQGAVTACAGQILSEHATTPPPPTTSTPQVTVEPEKPIEAEPTGYTGPFGSNYYWRVYDGSIPFDAIQVGTDASGQKTYFGCGYFTFGKIGAFVPGEIKEGDAHVYTHMGPTLYNTITFPKILCSPPKHRPQWKTVSTNDLKSMPNCHAIREGEFMGARFFVGRVFHKGRYVVGKVFPPGHRFAGMEIWVGNVVKYSNNFEILVYCQSG